jgi:hypothetical protein
MAEHEEYKFPDEKQEVMEAPEVAESLQIEVVDDTPEDDRNRKPAPRGLVEDLERDDLDEYSEKVKKRLGQMRRVWHDERRAKEQLAREKAETERFAQAQMEEVRRLRERLGNGEKAYVKVATDAAVGKLTTAKEHLKQAYESGDADRITEAQEALTDAKIHIKEVERFRPSLQTEDNVVEQRQQVQAPQAPAPTIDQKAEDWRQKNTWFGVDEEMTALALGLHEKLVRSGVDPRSDDYYRRVDETMRKRFPESFEDEEEAPVPQTKETEKPSRTKPATVVAPVTRTTAPRQVRLTSSQVALAKKLGLSNEQYAKELMKLESNNG